MTIGHHEGSNREFGPIIKIIIVCTIDTMEAISTMQCVHVIYSAVYNIIPYRIESFFRSRESCQIPWYSEPWRPSRKYSTKTYIDRSLRRDTDTLPAQICL